MPRQAVIRESLRLFTPASLGTTRLTTHEMEVRTPACCAGAHTVETQCVLCQTEPPDIPL